MRPFIQNGTCRDLCEMRTKREYLSCRRDLYHRIWRNSSERCGIHNTSSVRIIPGRTKNVSDLPGTYTDVKNLGIFSKPGPEDGKFPLGLSEYTFFIRFSI